MQSDVKKSPNILIVTVTVLIVIAVMALVFIGTRVKGSTNSVSEVAEYNVLLQDTQIKINLYLVGRSTFGEIRGQLSKLAIIPDGLKNSIQPAQINDIRQKVRQVESFRKDTKSLSTEIIRMTDESVLKADIYFPYVRDQLLKDRVALTNLEIQTIVGATTHVKTNFRIQSLFIQTLSNPSLYSELRDFVAISVKNVEDSYQRLLGTPFEENTREAMEISYQIQTLINKYLDQVEQVRVLTGGIEDNIDSMSKALEKVRKDALSNTSSNIGSIVFILIGGLVAIIVLVLVLGWLGKSSSSKESDASKSD